MAQSNKKADNQEVFTLLTDLVSHPSPSGQEVSVCDFLYTYLKNAGLPVEKDEVDDGGYNLIVKIGHPRFYFSSHLDVVNPPVSVSSDADRISGRGACDAKGSVAAMAVAAVQGFKSGITDFGLILTVGEETNFRGVNHIRSGFTDIPFAIVGEPTGLKAITGHFGYTELFIKTTGVTAHTSNPQEGDNAIEKLLTAVNHLHSVPVFPETPATLVHISGGVASNVVPDKAEAMYSFRVSPDDPNDYLSLFSQKVEGLATVTAGFSIPSVKSEIPSSLNFLESGGITKYTTELAYYQRGFVLGPGSIKVAHTPGEFVSKQELLEALSLYKRILSNF